MLLGAFHRIDALGRREHPAWPAEPDVRSLYFPLHFQPDGAANHASVRDTANDV